MTNPTREAFAVYEETINLALDAWFGGYCSRPHYDEHIDQMRAAASVIVAALSARAQGEAVELTLCCGREECGGECGNEWRGTAWYRKDTTPAVRAVDVSMVGEMIEVDFRADTITFRMDPGYVVAAGRYTIAALTQPEAE